MDHDFGFGAEKGDMGSYVAWCGLVEFTWQDVVHANAEHGRLIGLGRHGTGTVNLD